MKGSKGKAILFFLPFLIIFLLFWFLPFAYGVYLSLFQVKLTSGVGDFAGLSNYIKIFTKDSLHNTAFMLGLKNTLVFVVISVVPLVGVSFFLALLLDRIEGRLKSVFRTIFFMSYAVSVTAVSAIFIWIMNGNNGYLNNLLLKMGIISQAIPWLEAQPFAWISLLLATVWWTIGFNMMLFVNALNEIDVSLYEASSIDGAGYLKQLGSIILPNIRSVFSFVLMTTVIASFNLYGQANLITKGGPKQSTKPLIMVIYQTILEGKNLGVGSAMALLLGFVVMLFCLCQNYLSREKKEYMEVRK